MKVHAAQKKLAAKPVNDSGLTESKKQKRPMMEEMDNEVVLINLPMHFSMDF